MICKHTKKQCVHWQTDVYLHFFINSVSILPKDKLLYVVTGFKKPFLILDYTVSIKPWVNITIINTGYTVPFSLGGGGGCSEYLRFVYRNLRNKSSGPYTTNKILAASPWYFFIIVDVVIYISYIKFPHPSLIKFTECAAFFNTVLLQSTVGRSRALIWDKCLMKKMPIHLLLPPTYSARHVSKSAPIAPPPLPALSLHQ
jgi:hypothetical protein